MTKLRSSRAVSSALIASFLCAAFCLALLAFTSISRLREIASANRSHAESFVVAKPLTTQFEREILNARIFFIYYVTIQKPGSLASGWNRYHQAEDRLTTMSALVNRRDELSELREPVAKLQADLQAYGIALASTLNMVERGEVKGPHYDAQVKEWAARGAVVVGDAATVQIRCLSLGEADNAMILTSLHDGQVRAGAVWLGSLFLCFALTVILLRRVRRQDREEKQAYGGGLALTVEIAAGHAVEGATL